MTIEERVARLERAMGVAVGTTVSAEAPAGPTVTFTVPVRATDRIGAMSEAWGIVKAGAHGTFSASVENCA